MIIVDRKLLLQALKVIKPSVQTKSSLEILNFVHIKNCGIDGFTITGDSLDNRTTIDIRCALGISDMDLCFNFKDLLDNVSKSKETLYILDKDKNIVETKPVDDFPVVRAEPKNIKRLSIHASDFINACKVSVCCSKDPIRYAMMCIRIDVNDQYIDFSATDGFTIARKSISACSGFTTSLSIYKKTTDVICNAIKLLGDDDNVFIYFDNESAIITYKNVVITSFLNQDTFPNVNQIIGDSGTKVDISIDELKRMMVNIGTKKDDIVFISAEQDTADNVNNDIKLFKEITENFSEVYRIAGVVKTSSYCNTDNRKKKFAFNYSLLLSALSIFDKDVVSFYFNMNNTPVNIKSSGYDIAVIMPCCYDKFTG